MRIKGKRVLKNGAIAGYVYYSKEKKWKWRIVGRAQRGGSDPNEIPLSNLPNNPWNNERKYLNNIINENLRKKMNNQQKNKLLKLKNKLQKLEINSLREDFSLKSEADYLNQISEEIFGILENKIDNRTKRMYKTLRNNRQKNMIIQEKIKNIPNNNNNNYVNQLSDLFEVLEHANNQFTPKQLRNFLNPNSNMTEEEVIAYLSSLPNSNNNSSN